MQSSQSNSLQFLIWHKPLVLAALILVAGCTDRSAEAIRLAGEADRAFQSENLALAHEKIASALAERDDIPEIYLLKGRIDFASGEYGNAYSAYSNALALDGTNVEALQAVAQLGLRAGNLRESLNATERLLTLRPNEPSALVLRGVHAFIQRSFPDAIDYADRALKQQPDSEEARILKSRALFMVGKPAEAMAVVETAGKQGLTAGLVRTRLEINREMHDPVAMQQDFNLLRTLAPDDALLRIDEADLLFKRGQSPAAQALIASVLSAEKTTSEVATNAVGRLEAYNSLLAPTDIRQIASAGSQASRAELARYLIMRSQPGLAEILLPGLTGSDGLALKARAAIIGNDPAGALRLATSILQADATQCDALIAASQASLALGRTLDALRHGQRAAAECPKRTTGWIAYGQAYEARHQPANVDRAFRDGLLANPQSYEITMRYSNWLAASGRQREAVAVARNLTRKSPALLSGWSFYREVCIRTKNDCVADAEKGLAEAGTRFGADEELGTLPVGGLFGRMTRPG